MEFTEREFGDVKWKMKREKEERERRERQKTEEMI